MFTNYCNRVSDYIDDACTLHGMSKRNILLWVQALLHCTSRQNRNLYL